MKYKYNENEINTNTYIKKGRREDCPSWIDYDNLWNWFDTWFERMNYSNGVRRSIIELENDKLRKNDKK